MKLLFITLALIVLSQGFVNFNKGTNPISGSYFIAFHPNTTDAQNDKILSKLDVQKKFTFTKVRLVHVHMTEEEVQTLLTDDSNTILYVEQDQVARIAQTCVRENTPAWHLARVSDGAFIDPNQDYVYLDNAGSGVSSYILDTGIRTTHQEFQGRAFFGANFAGGVDTDCNGHGTHVAGTVGGRVYGIAKQVTLYAVKVLNCAGSGSYAGIISGIDWVRNHCTTPNKCNINMSLGGGLNQALNDAVDDIVDVGVTVVVAAGNNNGDACNISPASAPGAVTVGSTELASGTDEENFDRRSSFSNWGRCVDIFAPGSAVTSAWINSDTQINTISGTSMASPHVCGVASILQGQATRSPAVIDQLLKDGSTKDIVQLNCNAGGGCTITTRNLLHTSC